jgi:type VI secretion system protein ImpG
MSQDLWPFYDRELRFLRELAVDFSRKYPREAGYLGLEEAGRSNDPHVERLIEAVALLSSKVRLKIDDDFPELTDSLFSILYPHYLCPLPSFTILELVPNPGSSDLADGLPIPRHSRFQARAMVEAVEGRESIQCEYRSCYPVTLWPITVAEAKLVSPPLPDDKPDDAMCMLRLRFEAAGTQNLLETAFGEPGPTGVAPGLRFYLSGDGPLTSALYEVLFNNVLAVEFRSLNGPEVLRLEPEQVLRPSGFAADEGILPYPDTAFMGYRLLTEFFAYREKFLFFELHGWELARKAGALGRDGVEVLIYINREANPDYERAVKSSTFRLGCTPAINLFEKTADGFSLTQKKYDYPVVPDRHNLSGHEIYSLEVVYHRNASTSMEVKYEPFYSYRHSDRDKNRRYWYASRKASLWKDDSGTEVDLHFVDLDFDPNLPAEGVILAKTTCLSRDIPGKFRTAQSTLRFEPISALPVTVKWLRAPTPTRRPKLGRGAYWRLVSHLSLNHLSIAEGSSGRAALQEYLSLYDFADPEQAPELATIGQKVRDGILAVSSKRDVAFIPGDAGGGYARGMAVTVELNEDNYIGVGAYLFASVLERFYAMYASLNSFTRLTLATKQRGEIKRWPARAGDRVLV